MESFSLTNLYRADVEGVETYHTNNGGDTDVVLWPDTAGWRATVNPMEGPAVYFDLGPQPDHEHALVELNRQAFKVGLDRQQLDQDGYWLATVTDSHGTRELAREVDYDDALAEIADEIAHRPGVSRRQLDEALERIDHIEDCQEFDDLKVGGKTYMVEEVGPEIDQTTAEDELTARYREAMRRSQAELRYRL